MLIEYGAVRADIERWQWPSESIFSDWKSDLLGLTEAEYFDIYLLGGFLEKLNGKKPSTPDIDIVLMGCSDLHRIEAMIVNGIQSGLEAFQVFFDVMWFDRLPVYADDPGETRILTYMASNRWVVDGVVRKTYPNAAPTSTSLWQIERVFPTAKQRELMEQGYTYCHPLLISARSR